MNIILIVILSAVLQVFAPWWVVAIIPFVILFWRPASAWDAFGAGFWGIALPWLAYGYYLRFVSDSTLSDRVAAIFSLPSGILLLLVSGLVGGLVGGFAGLSGSFTRQIFHGHPTAVSTRA
ncbi:hypothetical protein [Dyadobacter luticola]|uniref:Uncharacterized protein n=1 Tax=Dyadobacter luticola TaxID=1979387 RepID=A0A5R9KVC1_9BACT|nr:hypothetical protein [Dyadobacter luticola]TLV00108.1 hypothetical protein FEN17_11390 [Dyadobacter luticola]